MKFGAEVEQSLLINRAKFQESRRFPSEDIKCGPNVVTQVILYGTGKMELVTGQVRPIHGHALIVTMSPDANVQRACTQ